jgi:hypothetical protein
MARKLRPDPVGPPWAKTAVYDYVVFLETLINELLTRTEVQLTSGEKDNLENAVKTLRPAVDLLADRFFEQLRDSQSWVCDAGYMALLEVMQTTNFASSHAIIRDSIKNYLTPIISLEVEARLQRDRTGPARKTRRAESIQEIINSAARQ